MRGLFVTATDTGVGKTVLSAALVAAMAAAGERVRAYKPVVTGLEDPDEIAARGSWTPDHELLAAVAGMSPEEVSPLRFGPAVSPHLAAELAGVRIDPAQLLAGAHAVIDADHETLIVEGVGGLLAPLADDYTVCDLAVAVGLPLLIAARPGLGTINHCLLTLHAARDAGLDIRAIVLTPWSQQPTAVEHSNHRTISRLGEVEVVALGKVESVTVSDLARTGNALPWQHWLSAPSNGAICET